MSNDKDFALYFFLGAILGTLCFIAFRIGLLF